MAELEPVQTEDHQPCFWGRNKRSHKKRTKSAINCILIWKKSNVIYINTQQNHNSACFSCSRRHAHMCKHCKQRHVFVYSIPYQIVILHSDHTHKKHICLHLYPSNTTIEIWNSKKHTNATDYSESQVYLQVGQHWLKERCVHLLHFLQMIAVSTEGKSNEHQRSFYSREENFHITLKVHRKNEI